AANINFYSGGLQAGEATAAHHRIGILNTGDNAANPGFNDRFRARRSATLMRTGLEIEVQDRAPSFVAALLESDDFRVFDSIIGVRAAPNYISSRIDDHSANVGVGRCQADSHACQLKSTAKKRLIGLGQSSHRDTGARRRDSTICDKRFYCLRGGKKKSSPSSGSATAAPLRPLGPRRTGTSLSAYGSAG